MQKYWISSNAQATVFPLSTTEMDDKDDMNTKENELEKLDPPSLVSLSSNSLSDSSTSTTPVELNVDHFESLTSANGMCGIC